MTPRWSRHLRARRLAAVRKIARWLGRPVDPYPPPPADVSLSPIEAHRPLLAQAPLALSRMNAGIDDVAAWQAAARAKLHELLGLPGRAPAPQARHAAEFAVPGGIRRRRVYLGVAEGLDIPVHMLWQGEPRDKRPLLIYLAGSTSGIHLSWGEARVPADHLRLAIGADMARQAALAGYLVVAIEQSAFGEREERQLRPRSPARCIDAHNRALWLGRSLTGERVADVRAVLDWIDAGGLPLPHDRRRQYLFGHSSGGTIALYTAAADPRVSGVVVSGALGMVRDGAALRRNPEGDAVVPGLLNWLETDDIVAVVAPRPFVAVSGSGDHIYPFDGVRRVVDSAAEVYRRLGAPQAISAHAGDGGHRYYPEVTWAAMATAFGPPQVRRT